MNSIRVRKTRDGRYFYDIWYRGKRYRKLTNLSKSETHQAALEKLRELEKSKLGILDNSPNPVLFEDYAKEFMSKYSKPNKRSWRSDENFLVHLKAFLKNRYLSSIGAELVETYKAKRIKMVSPATVNRELALLKTMFSKAVDWKYIESNPIAGKRVKKFKEDNKKERILTPEETCSLIEAANPHLKPILILALNTGMRRNEILSLKWDSIDLINKIILIESNKSKSGKPRRIPLNELVIDAIKSLPRERQLVFYNAVTKDSVKDIKTSFKTACRKAGITGVRLHDLRHTAATRMIEAGVDIVTVSKILGHSSIQMTMRYCHPTAENMQRAVDKLGQVFKNAVEIGKKVDTSGKCRPLIYRANTSLLYN